MNNPHPSGSRSLRLQAEPAQELEVFAERASMAGGGLEVGSRDHTLELQDPHPWTSLTVFPVPYTE